MTIAIKPEMIPADFSAFNGFNIAKHSYWEKTAEEINTYLTTGQFPERVQANGQQAVAPVTTNVAPATAPTYGYVAPTTSAAPQTAPVYSAATAPQTPPAAAFTQPANTYTPAAQNPATSNPTPTRNFTGFSF